MDTVDPSQTPPLLSFRARFIAAYSWRQLRFLLAVNTAIATVSFLSSFEPGNSVARTAAISLFFAHGIGHTIYFLAVVCNFSERLRPLFKFAALLATFVLGGWLGTFWVILAAEPLFGWRLEPSYIKGMLGNHTLVVVVLSFLIWVYAALYERLENMAARLAAKEINEQRLLRLKSQAELEAIQARVNPHFLFNTLNSIASLIPVDPGRAEDMVQRLSELFRYTLDASQVQTVRLEEEARALDQYLQIEKVRLEERLDYRIEVAPEVAQVRLPGLLLQPLVENSIKHGIAPQAKGGQIDVYCRLEGDGVLIEIRDTGQGMRASQQGAGFGLESVRERLDLHYGGKYRFALSEGDGVTATIWLPLSSPRSNTPNTDAGARDAKI